ncbi:hypothetical protein [Mycoplasmopsis columboralis]|uniref:Uncharacterized protein n=1 Tax=Mycoplasmopsis columboralis TaxID=171282 RepID=A0A449B7D3_9BACT|nr:hypothetical protein [Mycoplasmopsis columboralis]VEU76494.1 Uncharacterised protein [Mycoplasmopsis columboralis]
MQTLLKKLQKVNRFNFLSILASNNEAKILKYFDSNRLISFDQIIYKFKISILTIISLIALWNSVFLFFYIFDFQSKTYHTVEIVSITIISLIVGVIVVWNIFDLLILFWEHHVQKSKFKFLKTTIKKESEKIEFLNEVFDSEKASNALLYKSKDFNQLIINVELVSLNLASDKQKALATLQKVTKLETNILQIIRSRTLKKVAVPLFVNLLLWFSIFILMILLTLIVSYKLLELPEGIRITKSINEGSFWDISSIFVTFAFIKTSNYFKEFQAQKEQYIQTILHNNQNAQNMLAQLSIEKLNYQQIIEILMNLTFVNDKKFIKLYRRQTKINKYKITNILKEITKEFQNQIEN